MTPVVGLRPATADDRMALWRWRNDPETRRASFDERDIAQEEHTRWLGASLARPDRRIWIVTADDADAGMIRLDLLDDCATISINVAPEQRGRGVGPAALRAMMREAGPLGVRRLVAQVKPGNARSRAAFVRAGFISSAAGAVVRYERAARLQVVAAIQARMGSTRLPGKVLRSLAGRPLIEWMVLRLAASAAVDAVAISTSVEAANDPIEDLGSRLGVPVVRGSETDLVERLLRTATRFGGDAVVRVTGDCPFVEPAVVDRLVGVFSVRCPNVDFVTNNDPPTFPHGLDAEVIPTATLRRLDREVSDPYFREWIPLWVKGHRRAFRIVNVPSEVDLTHHRWTVDYPADLAFADRVFRALAPGHGATFAMDDVVAFLAEHPEIVALNAEHTHR